jgi:hypothetical protein
VPPKPTKVSAASDRDNVLFIPRRAFGASDASDASDARGLLFHPAGGARDEKFARKKKTPPTRLDA